MSTNNTNFNRDFIYTVPETILFHPEMKLLELKIYMIIRSFMDTTGKAYPSNNWISAKCGADRRSIIRSLKKLIQHGFIKKIIENGHRLLFVNNTPCPFDLVTQMSPPSDTDVTPPSDTDVTQLVSNINTSKIIKEKEMLKEKEACFVDTEYQYPDTLYNNSESRKEEKEVSVKEMMESNEYELDEQLIEDWKKVRKAKKAPITSTAWRRLLGELEKCRGFGISPREAFETMVEHGWSSLNAAWIQKRNGYNKNYDENTNSWGIIKPMNLGGA